MKYLLSPRKTVCTMTAVAAAMLAISGFAAASYKNLNYFWYYSEINKDGTYRFEIEQPVTPQKYQAFIEISKYKDFTIVEKAFPLSLNSSKKLACLINPADIPSGKYYYRAAIYPTADVTTWCNSKVYEPGNDTEYILQYIDKGTGTPFAEGNIPVDENVYSSASLADGKMLTLESVWLRSGLNSTPLMPTTAPGLDPKALANGEYVLTGTLENHATVPYDSFSHGVIVKNGVIYIGVGSSSSFHPTVSVTNYTETLNNNPDRVLIYRYDLATGKFLKPIKVTNLVDYSGSTLDMTKYRIMPWLRVDDNGTPYFTCIPLYASVNASYKAIETIPIYILDFDKIAENETSDYATLSATMLNGDIEPSKTETEFVFPTATGNTRANNYTLWGMSCNRVMSAASAAEDWSSKINRWTPAKNYTPTKFTINKYPFAASDAENAFRTYTTKIYPISDTQLYIHATPGLYYNKIDFTNYADFEPSFYKISGTSATLQNKLSDAISDGTALASPTESKRVSGFPIIKIGDVTVAAYGHLSATDDATAVQLLQIVDPEKGFEAGNIVPLWDLYAETGLSTSKFQALDMAFIPASEWVEDNATASDGLLGHLLVYAAGGGMGLYRIATNGDNSNGIDTIADSEMNAVSISGDKLLVKSAVSDINIYDLQGRTVSHFDLLNEGTYTLSEFVPAITPGIYILRASTTTLKFVIN